MSRSGLILPVYVPSLLLSLAQGVLIPTLPLYARSLGVTIALVSFAVGATPIGTLVADVPAGVLLERFGRRRTMLFGCASVALSYLLVPLLKSYAVLVVLMCLGGIGSSLWAISRHVYLAEATRPDERGQAISTFGGVNRVGTFGGPAVGGIVASHFGLASAFTVSGGLAVAGLFLSYLFVPESTKRATAVSTRAYLRTLGTVVVKNGGVLTKAGFAQLCSQMIRSGRQIIVPLYASYALGLDVAAIGAIISISSAIDMALFLPAGIIMDRVGRKAAIIPCFVILSIGMAMVPFTKSYGTLLIATTVMGFGNGIGSGTMMTLGADLAPTEAVGAFLGVWRLIGDVGGAGGPLVVGGVAGLLGLATSAFVLAGVGLASVIFFAFTVPETGRRARRRKDPVPNRAP